MSPGCSKIFGLQLQPVYLPPLAHKYDASLLEGESTGRSHAALTESP